MFRYLSFFIVSAVLLWGCTESPQTQSLKEGSAGLSRISGRIVTPLEKTYLYVYRKGMDLYGPALYLSEATDESGSFDLELPPGDYILVARKRTNGETTGPVVAGDFRSEFVEIQVGLQDRELTLVAPVKVGDTGVAGAPAAATATGISGQVTDVEGHPVQGLRVHIYDHVQMSERPKYVTEKTGPDGRFSFVLPEGGTYYICARDKFGGPPGVGDLYGRYDKGTIEPSAVIVKEGETLQNIDITVTRVW